jgi:predicted SprT family Zn-dependent metalloprotease
MSNIQTVRDLVESCKRKAEALYDVDLSKVELRLNLVGVNAGIAGRDRRGWYLRFNTAMINGEGYNHIVNDTIPHEIAHIVCFMKPKLGSGHDAGWARITRELGGSGQRCHNEAVVYATGRTYEYTCSEGTTVRMSQQRHRKIQRGVTYTLKRGGKVCRECSFRVVGVSGRALTPTTPQPVAAKKTPVAAKKTPVARATEPKAFVGTKAGRVRNMIAKCLEKGHTAAETQDLATDFAVNILGMKTAMAKRYVAENYSKVAA